MKFLVIVRFVRFVDRVRPDADGPVQKVQEWDMPLVIVLPIDAI